MVGPVIGIVVWQLFSVFELKYKHCSNITQIYQNENIFCLFSFIEFCTQQYKNIFSHFSIKSLSSTAIFFLSLSRCSLTWLRRVEELQLEAESRQLAPPPPPLPVEADLETHLGSDAKNLASLSRHDLEPHCPKRMYFL